MIKAKRATIVLSEKFGIEVDGYLLPSGEFRAGMEGSSRLVGYEESWLSQVVRRRPKVLEALKEEGYTGGHVEIEVNSENLRGASRVKTISLDDLNAVIEYAAGEKKPKAKTISKALRKATIVDFFRHAFGVAPLSHQEKMEIIDSLFEEAREELRQQMLPGDLEVYGADACEDIFCLN